MRIQEAEPKVIYSVDGNRCKVAHALREVISPVLQRYIKPEDRVIEIATGLGRLSRVFPELLDEVVFFDNNPVTLSKFHTVEPQARLLAADTRALPFKDEGVDVFIGLSPYPALNLYSLQEAKRVLKPGGRILAFQDNVYQDNVYINHVDSESNLGSGPCLTGPEALDIKHAYLIEVAPEVGFTVQEGYSPIEAGYVGNLSQCLIGPENISRIYKSGMEEGKVLYGFIKLPDSPSNSVGHIYLTDFRPGEQVSINLPIDQRGSLLNGTELILGKDYIEYVQIKYLVLQKTNINPRG